MKLQKMRYIQIGLCLFLMTSCFSKSKSPDFSDFPKTKIDTIGDYYFGKLIYDEFRHLENLKDTTVTNWFKAQDDFTEKYFEEVTYQKKIAEQLRSQNINDAKVITNIKYSDNGFAFYLKQDFNNRVIVSVA